MLQRVPQRISPLHHANIPASLITPEGKTVETDYVYEYLDQVIRESNNTKVGVEGEKVGQLAFRNMKNTSS